MRLITSKENKAFTLIELLVVIAIIGILSSVVLASLSNSRANARDARRVQDFNQIRTAVNMYYNDNGQWPGASSSNDQFSKSCTGTSIYNDLVGGGYLSTMPTDPSEDNLSCSNLSDLPSTSDDYYGWDNIDSDTGMEACFGINNIESSDGAGELEGYNQREAYQGGGGDGDLYDGVMDFIYCFNG